MNHTTRLIIAALVIAAAIFEVSRSGPRLNAESPASDNSDQSNNGSPYHADPNHLWNRVHQYFHSRTAPDGQNFGEDDVDPLLWTETNYLLTGASHKRAIDLLDEFLRTHGERLIAEPLKRAVFQHDLWAVFDWLVTTTTDRYPPEKRHVAEARELEGRLATVIRSVALTRDQVTSLPDNYAAALASKAFPARFDAEHRDRAFLPPEMCSASGPWVTLNPFSSVPLAHSYAFSHSAFAIIINLPGGREETIKYLKKLWEFSQPFVADTRFPDRTTVLNPDLPQLPSGTQMALVRKMLLIDQDGDIVPSGLTEIIQLRVFHEPSRVDYHHESDFHGDQDFFELRFSRRKVFAGEAGGLRAVGQDERDFFVFQSHGFDHLEQEPDRQIWKRMPVTLQACAACHRGLGIHSMLSVTRLLRPNQFSGWFDPQSPVSGAAELKRRRYDWGLLEGLMQRGGTLRR